MIAHKLLKIFLANYPPWKTYVHKDHSDTATYQLYSVNEDGTITCNKIDFMGIPVQVFGMNPADLVEATNDD